MGWNHQLGNFVVFSPKKNKFPKETPALNQAVVSNGDPDGAWHLIQELGEDPIRETAGVKGPGVLNTGPGGDVKKLQHMDVSTNTVDGQNPAPPGMVKTLWIMG